MKTLASVVALTAVLVSALPFLLLGQQSVPQVEPLDIDKAWEIGWPEHDFSSEAKAMPPQCRSERPHFLIDTTLFAGAKKIDQWGGSFFPLIDTKEMTFSNSRDGDMGTRGSRVLTQLWRALERYPPGRYTLSMEIRNNNRFAIAGCDLVFATKKFDLVKTKPSPTPTARVEIALPGKRIQAQKGTVTARGSMSVVASDMNATIDNLVASIDESKGSVCIGFDYFGARSQFSSGIGSHLLLRFFDKHGNYLSHFKTREKFGSAQDMDVLNEETRRLLNAVPLKKQGNRFCYPINARDASFIASVEVGFMPGQ